MNEFCVPGHPSLKKEGKFQLNRELKAPLGGFGGESEGEKKY
jgi:hypothetical protein